MTQLCLNYDNNDDSAYGSDRGVVCSRQKRRCQPFSLRDSSVLQANISSEGFHQRRKTYSPPVIYR